MNKIFKVIWCSSSQVWVAVSELSKVKPVSSVSSVKKTSSAVSTLLKTTALAIPFALSPLAAHAYVAIGSMNGGYASEYGANAKPKPLPDGRPADDTWAYDYKNPGNKSYDNAARTGNAPDSYSPSGKFAYGVAIGNNTDVLTSVGSSNGIAIGDYAQAKGGLATSIGAFSHADSIGSTAIGTAARASGFNSLAMMRQSAATGEYSAAIGSVAYAKGKASFAFGASATANGEQSIAIGNTSPKTLDGLPGQGEAQRTKYDGLNNTQTNGARSVAIGSGAKTNGDDSFAFGSGAKTGSYNKERDQYLDEEVYRTAAAANKAIAFGTTANATGNASIAFGANSLGAETNSIAFGVEAKARKADAIAFGSNANASEANAIAFGSNAEALHENVITIGKDSKATKKGAMTIGESAQSNANNSLALGNGTIINQEDIKNKNAKYTNDGFEIENGVVAIANKGKERRLVNLAAGREDTDAVNVKQLTEVNDNLAKSIAGPNYKGYTVDDGNGRYTYKAPDFNIKNQTLHNVKEAVELAQTNYVSVNADKTKQTDADSNYDNLGAKAAGSIALGEFTGTSATATDSVAIGHNTTVNGQNTVAIGANITAATNGSVILGDSSEAGGSHATKTVPSKEIDGHIYTFAGKAEDAGRFVSVGKNGNERQIKNVAAGHVEADSTDAINGSQLYAVASRVEQGWKITAAKTGTGEVSGNAEKKVAMGDTVTLTAGDNIKITQNEKNLTVATKENVNFTTVTTGNTTLGDNGLTINNGPSITQDGINAGDKKITNVSNGTISPNSKDAVNGSQLYATNQNVTNNANNIAKGLNFQGDNTDVTVNRQLGETLNINGGADKNNLSDNNIGVVGAGSSSTSNGGLTVKLAKDLKGLNSVETKEIKLGDKNSNTTIKYDGDRIKYGDKTVANLDDEKHITNTTYAVGNDGNVSLTYTDGKGNVVNGMTATITGVAKNDLSNINKAGETKIQNLAKDAIGMENGENTVASHRDVNGVKTFKVDVKGDLANITSITGGANTGKVEFAGDQVVNVAGDNSIKLDAKTGDITGLTNKTIDGSDFATKGRAATEEQLKATGDQVTNNLTKKGLNFGTQSTEVIHKNLGEKLEIVGEGTEADDRYDATNIKTMTKDGKVVVGLAKDITADKVTVGQKGEPGKDGVDGQIGVNGKDGSAVVLNGKDGSIGLNGKDGANGVSIKGDQGPAGVDGAAGETKNRIVYEYKDPKDPNKTIKEDVATLNDGLKFAGDDGQTDSSKVIAKKLNQQVDIVGGADKDQLTENNIGVNNDNGKLKVQLAKDVNLTQDGSVTIGDTALNNGGLTITGGPSVTKGGINAGDKQITNVDSGLKKDGTKVALKDAEGDTLNNAVNVGDLKESISNITDSGFGLTDENGNDVKAKLGETVTVKGDGSVTTKVIEEDGKAKLQVGLNKDVTIGNDKEPGTITVKGENGKDGISINGKDGTIGLKGEDGKDGIALNGKDGTIGINGKDGSNGKITVAQGKAGLDGKDGETKTRIVYEKPNGDKEEVATLNDGLRFRGDKGDSIAKKLNEELEILGKLDPNAAVTDKNLRVDNDAGKLVLKMAKQLQDLTSATFIDETTGNKSVIDGNGLTVTPKDADSTKTVSVTDKGLNNGGNQIVNVDSGLKKDGAKVELKDAQGDTLNNAVNVGDLKESITNLTNNGFGLTDENGKDVKAKLGETVTVKGDGSVTTKVIEEDGKAKLQVGLNKDVTIGNDKEPGTITVKGENGKDGIALNGKDGTIGINGKDGSNGKITVAQGQAGLDGNDGKDGKTKTRIVYEKPNGDKEEVATLNDGLRFTGNNEVENSHKLNSLVTIKGEGVDKAASEKFESAAGNVNVKADGKGTLEVQLAKDLKNIDSISNKDGQKIEFKDGGTTISGGNVSVAGNNITHVRAGKDDTDAVNVKQLKDGIAQATTKVAAGKNVNVTSDKNPDGSTTYTVATKDDVDFTSVTTGNTKMNDGGITIKAAEGGKTNVTLTNKGLDNGGNKVVNVADGDISATSKDAVNGSQLHNTKVELTNKGLDFGAQSGADIHKNLGEKLEIVGEGTKADDRYDATNIKTMTKDGKVVIGLDKDLKSDSVTVGSVGKDGKPGVDGKVGVNGKDGSSVVINGKDGSIGLTGPKGADGKSPSITVRTENGTTTVNEKDAGKPVERIKYTDSNNNTREVATLDDGLKFTGDDGKTVNRTLGSNLNIKGGAKDATSKDNIRITNDGKNGLKVQLANNVTLDNNGSVNIGGTRVDNNGITTNNGKGPSVTNNGINAGNQKITNVKDGAVNATSKDAVNGSQLHRAVQNIDNKFGDVYGKMNKINKEARAGIAGANAAAGLPQVYLPGKSMVAASAGTFKGQNALAIGYSRSSDNGKVILKLQGNANTQGDVGGSVGVGYQW